MKSISLNATLLHLIFISLEHLLKNKGISKTKFRLEVLNIFDSYAYAISQDVIESHLTDFDRITLYRTLKLFIEQGILHEIALPNQENKYALCEENCENQSAHSHDHIHFNCTKCQKVFCIDIPEQPMITLENYQVDEIELHVKGTCKDCLKPA
jgi:Fur family ferric uptake transcriptional regulator